MVSIININNGIRNPAHGYQNCDTSPILIFGGCINVRDTLETPSCYLVQSHSKPHKKLGCIKVILACYIDPNDIKSKNTVKYLYRTF
jgi:hypothetical protein